MDLRSAAQNPARYEADVCIVGAGPAGITVARELSNCGLKVMLVESGGIKDDRAALALYEGQSIGHPVDLTLGRYRIFGGASVRWGGRSANLDPIDFAQRDWVERSGWPFGPEIMDGYYEKAVFSCNFKAPWIEKDQIFKELKIEMPSFVTGAVEPFVWRFASPDFAEVKPDLGDKLTLGYRAATRFGPTYLPQLTKSANVDILLYANLVSFLPDETRAAVASAEFSTMDGKKAVVRARRFVLATSGIENARILLNLPEPLLSRVNAHDQIGRGFAQHPRGVIGIIRASKAQALKLQTIFNNYLRPRSVPVSYEVGLALTTKAQEENGLLNASVALNYEADDESIWKAGRRLKAAISDRQPYARLPKDLTVIALGVPSVGINIMRRLVLRREVRHPRPHIRAIVDLEQPARFESRITLGDTRDQMGMLRCIVDWRLGEEERRTSRFFAEALDAELRAADLGHLEKRPWLEDGAPITVDDLGGNLHFIGATRMASRPEDGVVDTDCRVFGIDNLYVAGASVFPTGGHANPMMTIVALAIRLGEHLRQIGEAETLGAQALEGKRMKVLVLGARGFIGGEIVNRMAADPMIEVIPAGRGRPGQAGGAWSRYRAFDLGNPSGWAAAMEGCDAVINCAKFPEGEEANCTMMGGLIDAARQTGVKKLIHFSSMAAFGAVRGNIIDEDTAPVAPFSAYGRDKLLTEQVCAEKAGDGLSILALRPTLVYGPGGPQWYEYFVGALKRGRLRRLKHNGGGIANLVYVGDIARICRDALDRDLPPFAAMVANGPDRISFNDYFSLLASKLAGKELDELSRSPKVWKIRRILFRLMRKAGQKLPPLHKIADAQIFTLEPWDAYTAPSFYQSKVAPELGLDARESLETVLDRIKG